MTRKAKILQFILDNPKATYQDWERFQIGEPTIRLKKVGTTGVLINLSKNEGWIDPLSWGNNYQAGLRLHVEQALKEFIEAGGAVEQLDEVESLTSELKQEIADLLAKVDRFKQKNEVLGHYYKGFMLELQEAIRYHDSNPEGKYLNGGKLLENMVMVINENASLEENFSKIRNLTLS